MNVKLSEGQLIEVIHYVFDTKEILNGKTDLSLYIKDSIDLGEVMAVVKNKFSIEPRKKELFKTYFLLEDVLKIFNDEIKV